MAHGGKRLGAGRKAGSATTKTREIANAVAEGLTPLEYLTSVFRDLNADEAKRIDAAKAAAPYVHPRLTATTLSGPEGGPIQTQAVPVEWTIIDPATPNSP
jgi:hypothetical protein